MSVAVNDSSTTAVMFAPKIFSYGSTTTSPPIISIPNAFAAPINVLIKSPDCVTPAITSTPDNSAKVPVFSDNGLLYWSQNPTVFSLSKILTPLTSPVKLTATAKSIKPLGLVPLTLKT